MDCVDAKADDHTTADTGPKTGLHFLESGFMNVLSMRRLK